MTDIVERLRRFKTGCDKPECERMIFTPLVCEEAADEIERLRAALYEAEHFCELGLNSGEATHWEAALGDILQIARAALEGK